jgi:putative flippase GtrA
MARPEAEVATAPAPFFKRPLVQKLLRYCAASAAGTVAGLAALVFFHAVLEWPGVAANIASVTIGVIPNWLINRYWTWQRTGRDRMTLEAIVFWLIAIVGLILSSVFVAYADNRWGTTFAIAVAQMVGFGVLWVGRFIFLDRVLYRVARAIEEAEYEHAHSTGHEEDSRGTG